MTETNFTPLFVKSIFNENSIVLVNFKKVNGEIRNMRCTLDERLIEHVRPDLLVPPSEGTAGYERDENHFSVFDLDKKDWRSFLIKNVISIKGE